MRWYFSDIPYTLHVSQTLIEMFWFVLSCSSDIRRLLVNQCTWLYDCKHTCTYRHILIVSPFICVLHLSSPRAIILIHNVFFENTFLVFHTWHPTQLTLSKLDSLQPTPRPECLSEGGAHSHHLHLLNLHLPVCFTAPHLFVLFVLHLIRAAQ